MALKFNCPKCNQEIIVRYIKFGEAAQCKNCSTEVVVPVDSIIMEEPDRIPDKSSSEINIFGNRLSNAELKPASPEEQEYVIREFRKRRTRQGFIFILSPIIPVLVRMYLNAPYGHLLFIGLFILVIATWFNWRCPRCKIGFINKINIPYCPNCGIKLK